MFAIKKRVKFRAKLAVQKSLTLHCSFIINELHIYKKKPLKNVCLRHRSVLIKYTFHMLFVMYGAFVQS